MNPSGPPEQPANFTKPHRVTGTPTTSDTADTPIVQRLAVAGNVCALVVLAVLAANGDVLFGSAGDGGGSARAEVASPMTRPAAAAAAGRAVLVVVDGLRADTASDPRVMPYLSDLARSGGAATAHAESLIPSTIAGIAALASGRVLGPASFLHDFRSPAAGDGGVFAAVRDAGGRSFVAGPRLWTDMYGRWVDGSRVPGGFVVGDEAHLVDAARDALRGGRYRLVVLHLTGTDGAAHRFGGTSREYAAAAARADAAIGRLASELPADACLVVTSDHGVTDRGGHAGPEPAVLRTPLVTYGPGLPVGPFGPVRQADVPGLLHHALALGGPPAGPKPLARRPPARLLAMASVTLLAAWCALRILRDTAGPAAPWRTALCAAPWAVLPLLLLGFSDAAAVAALLALALGAIRSAVPGAPPGLFAALAGTVAAGLVRVCDSLLLGAEAPAANVTQAAAVCLMYGGAVAIVVRSTRRSHGRRLDAGSREAGEGLAWPQRLRWGVMLGAGAAGAYATGGGVLAALYGGGVAAGGVAGALLLLSGPGGRAGGDLLTRLRSERLRDRYGSLVAGALGGVAHVPLGWLAGRTSSLSSIDVRAGYAALELDWGLPLAVVIVAFAQAAIPLGVVIGLAPHVARLGREPASQFAAGLALGPVGLAAGAGLTLLCAPAGPTSYALAVGALLRALSETAYLFLGAVAAVTATAGLRMPSTRRAGTPAP